MNENDRIAGVLYGSLCADALALGAHWIYDQDELRREFGRVTDFLDPRQDSYHPTKKRGEQTHYGDQALTLMDSLAAGDGFTMETFAQDWRHMWQGYRDYFDHATKETLKNLSEGMPIGGAGSKSNELGGAARIAPLVAWITNESVESVTTAARAQTTFTHRSKIAADAAEFLTRFVFALLTGAEVPAARDQAANASYDELDVRGMLARVHETKTLENAAAAKSLGLACPAPKALPTLLMILDRCGDNLETAFIENVMAGGDNAARGLALGMILGARFGKSGIPQRWVDQLEAAPRIEAFLQKTRAGSIAQK